MGCRYGTHPRNASKPPKTWSGTKVISNLPFPSILHYFLHLDLDFLRNGGVLVKCPLDFLHLSGVEDCLGDGGPDPCDAAGQANASPGEDQDWIGGCSVNKPLLFIPTGLNSTKLNYLLWETKDPKTYISHIQ